MTDTKIMERVVARAMGGTYAATGFKAVIKHNEKGYFAEVEITLTTTALISSDAMTRKVFLVDVYQSIADEYGVTGFTPEFVDEDGKAIADGLDDLASDVMDFGNCPLCKSPLTSEEHDRSERYGSKCYNCFEEVSN